MEEQERKLYSDEKVLLRTSFFGGFEKKEVLEYIDKLREQNRVMGRELDDRISEVSAARSELSARVSSFEAKITEMERQLEERGGRIKELSGVVESLRGEVGQQKQRVVEQEMQLNQQKDQNKQLSLQAQSYEYKAKRYDDFSAQLGDILLEARRTANETVAEAEQKAEEIKHDAFAATERVTVQIKAMRRELRDVRSRIEGIMSDFTARLDEMDRMLDGAMAGAKPCNKQAAAQAEEGDGEAAPEAEAVTEAKSEESREFFQ